MLQLNQMLNTRIKAKIAEEYICRLNYMVEICYLGLILGVIGDQVWGRYHGVDQRWAHKPRWENREDYVYECCSSH